MTSRCARTGPLVLHGDRGYSVKSAKGQASYYYSQPSFAVEGTLTLPQGDVKVRGTAWVDREWSSQPLAEDQSGWTGSRSPSTAAKADGISPARHCRRRYTSATWIAADGTPTPTPTGTRRHAACDQPRHGARRADAVAPDLAGPRARRDGRRTEPAVLDGAAHPLLGRPGACDRQPSRQGHTLR